MEHTRNFDKQNSMTNQSQHQLHRRNIIKRERCVGKILKNRHSFVKFVTIQTFPLLASYLHQRITITSDKSLESLQLSFDFFSERDIKIKPQLYQLNIERSRLLLLIQLYSYIYLWPVISKSIPLKSVCKFFCQNWSRPDHFCCQNPSVRTNLQPKLLLFCQFWSTCKMYFLRIQLNL